MVACGINFFSLDLISTLLLFDNLANTKGILPERSYF